MKRYGLEELLDELDMSRERLLVAIEPLPDEAFLAPNAVGSWSIADVLANLTAWEAEMVTGLLKINQGKRPDALLRALKDTKAYDKQRTAENRDRSLDSIFGDFQKVRVQLEEWLEHFSERVLNNPKRFPYFKGKTLAEIIAMTTFQHEQRLIPKVEVFASIWLAEEAAQAEAEDLSAEMPPSEGMISLDDVNSSSAETPGETP